MDSQTATIDIQDQGVGTLSGSSRPRVAAERKIRQYWNWVWRSVIAFALIVGMGVLIVTASDGFVGDSLTAQEVANITLARRVVLAEILTYGNTDPVQAVVSPDAVLSIADEQWVGPAGMQQMVAWLDEQVPDRIILVDSVETLGDRVVLDGRIAGTLSPGFLDTISREGQSPINAVFTMVVTDSQLTVLQIDLSAD